MTDDTLLSRIDNHIVSQIMHPDVRADLGLAAASIRALQDAAKKARTALNMHEVWEGNLIMSPAELHDIPAPTQDMWDQIVSHLQPTRAEAFAAINTALGDA